MFAGDNMLTAVSVARDCGIISFGSRVTTVQCHSNGPDSDPTISYLIRNQTVQTLVSFINK